MDTTGNYALTPDQQKAIAYGAMKMRHYEYTEQS